METCYECKIDKDKVDKALAEVRNSFKESTMLMSIADWECLRRDYENIITMFSGKKYIILNPPFITSVEAEEYKGDLPEGLQDML